LPSAAPVFHGVRKAVICYLLIPALAIAAILILYLAPGGSQGLVLALPGVVALPVLSLAPAFTREYLPLSRPATRGDQYAENMILMVVTMIAMAGLMVASYLAWEFGVIWYALGIELIVAALLYRGLSRSISKRPMGRPYDDLPGAGRATESSGS